MKTIHPTELKALIDRGAAVDLLDVRTPGEYRAAHVAGARLMPLDELDVEALRQGRNGATGPTYVLCKSGSRAKAAAGRLTAAGLDAVVVEGGTDACVAEGLPVVRGRGGIPLHRQALLGAGLVVWAGLLLSWLVHPWFIAVTAFAGCGLLLAGLADVCLMAMLLAKMPWNRSSKQDRDPSPGGTAGGCCANAATG